MENHLTILPGTPDDGNREYLPEKIKTTDIVVNENGNNSIVYPKRLQEFTDTILDGVEDTWYEYVPECYDETRKVPLVIGLHGGLMTGWGHAVYTSWTLVADREGFICLFPNAHEKRMWMNEGVFDNFKQEMAPDLPIVLPPEKIEDNHDVNMILALINRMKEKYNIDEGRIFMQGMSMGNIMTGQFARYYGNILAGAAGSGGPCEPFLLFDEEGKIKNRAGHLAVWQSRPEKNGLPPGKTYDEFSVNKLNRFYWMKINGCDPVPEISIVGENNFAFYKGKKLTLYTWTSKTGTTDRPWTKRFCTGITCFRGREGKKTEASPTPRRSFHGKGMTTPLPLGRALTGPGLEIRWCPWGKRRFTGKS